MTTCYVPLPMFNHKLFIKSLWEDKDFSKKQELIENLEDYKNPLDTPNAKPGIKYWKLFPVYEKTEIDPKFFKSEYNDYFEEKK